MTNLINNMEVIYGITARGNRYTYLILPNLKYDSNNPNTDRKEIISRALTGTTNESGLGIFTEFRCNVTFAINDSKKTFEFEELSDLFIEPEEWKSEIYNRVKKVREWIKEIKEHHVFEMRF